ncbi:ATP-grasp domain-containing protein [Virgibacillus sp. YIM 98842]|uniref:ATP-grasp domain-containing protein n=1 Tax=Virgibacillus sp. YIM 98842 TaxID=2663533 RepID=UPI0013DB30D5|nr:ATP-grasp domain-containing protein [Virgibacillus sp. YIM 98842]
MNILLCSAGRRVKIVQYLKESLNKKGGIVVTADCDSKAPALYFGDKKELIPRIDSQDYLNEVIRICKKHNIQGVISLIDPELETLAKNKELFDEIGVSLVLSPFKMVQYCFDKQETYNYLNAINIPAVPTYSELESVLLLLDKQKMDFPLVVKPGKGSASIGINIVNNLTDLEYTFSKDDNLIIQPYLKDREYGIDVYIDMISGEMVDIFIKEKLKMRSGETDKSISIHNKEIEGLIKSFMLKADFAGPIDIDCFEHNGKYYISEINPRFGGGYPHSQEMGCDFMEYIVHNLEGKINEAYTSYQYEENIVMMKYDDVVLRKEK